ncbi:MAG TPA: hypothetical protein VGI39_01665 [Polyangiaceae bacterium]|jgi:hypothetical protein
MPKLVPLLRDGADDLERTLLAAAREDGPPDDLARARTLDALATLSRTTAAAGATAAGWRWARLLKPALRTWLTAGGIGAIATAAATALHVARTSAPAPQSEIAAPAHTAPSAAPPATLAHLASPSPATPPPTTAAPLVAPARPPPITHTPPSPRVAKVLPSSPRAPAPPPTTAPGTDGASSPAPPGQGDRLVAPPAPPPPEPPAGPSSLKLEAALLESVRAALASARTGQALATLDEYDARFPAGVLEEEASVLRVEGLLAAGRRDDARQAALAFARKHPSSSYLPSIRARLGAP